MGSRIGAAVCAAAIVCAAALPAGAGETVGTLEEVLRSTLLFHESLKIAGEDLEQAELRRKRFFMSLTPDVSLQAYGQRVSGGTGGGDAAGGSEGGGSTGPVFFPGGTWYGYSLSITQPLYTGGRALAAYRGAGNQSEALGIQQGLVRRELLTAAAEAYYAVLAAMETVRIGEQAVVRAERSMDLASRRLELGEGVKTDLLRAEVNLAQVQSDLIGYRRLLADAREVVYRLCGQPLAETPARPASLGTVEGDLEELVGEALERRPERRQDRYGILAAEEDVREKKGRFLPALYAAGSYYGAGDEPSDQETGWQAGVYLQLPIYERASRFYLLRESRSALRQAELREQGRQRDIALEVGRLYNSLAASTARLSTLDKRVKLAEENNLLAEKRFAVGLADSLETVDTQTALLGAQVDLTAERLRHEIATLRLAKALGRELYPEMHLEPADGQGEGGGDE